MPTKLIRKQFLLTEEENRQIESEANNEGLSVSNLTRKRHGLEPLEAGGKRENTGRPSKNKKNDKMK
jgi:hypothetical protein